MKRTKTHDGLDEARAIFLSKEDLAMEDCDKLVVLLKKLLTHSLEDNIKFEVNGLLARAYQVRAAIFRKQAEKNLAHNTDKKLLLGWIASAREDAQLFLHHYPAKDRIQKSMTVFLSEVEDLEKMVKGAPAKLNAPVPKAAIKPVAVRPKAARQKIQAPLPDASLPSLTDLHNLFARGSDFKHRGFSGAQNDRSFHHHPKEHPEKLPHAHQSMQTHITQPKGRKK
jgi:hypothetical protein